MHSRRLGLSALIVGALIVGINAAWSKEPLKIRIAWTTVPGQMTPILFERKELLKHYGTSYVVEHLHFAGSGPMVTALATGEVDIAPLAPSSFGVAIENARMDDIRVISDVYQDGVGDHYSNEFLVLKDSPIRRIEDLKGKVLAVNAVGGGSDIALRAVLRKYHLEDKKDYTVIETQFSNMPAMLEERKVDLVGLVALFAHSMEKRGTARTLFTVKDALGQSQSLFNVARAGFLENNRAALYDFFEDYVRALHWFLDPANRKAAIGIVAQFNKRSPAVFSSYLFTNGDYYRDHNARPNLDALQHNIQTLKELGFLKTDIDVKRHADLGFIEEAAKRLK